jgi:sterol desaturase/sphingolipid hydroxylase (fatty acid hydroxylase superfamily)
VDWLAQRPAILALPLLLALLAAAEGLWLGRRGGYDWRAYWASFAIAIGRQATARLASGGVAGTLLAFAATFRVATLAMDRWWHWLLLFLGQEFCYYWMHRADHRIRWFWLNHSVHHSPEQYTLAAAYRLGWAGKFTAASVFFAPLVWLGFPVPLVLAALALNLLYQFWLHTELIGRLPRWFEYLFNTPAHHRVHHASNPEYLDCNYGGVLIVFDRVFGSFREARPGVPLRYGLADPVGSHNPLRIVLHEWRKLFRDLRQVHDWHSAWRTVFGPPGQPSGGPP